MRYEIHPAAELFPLMTEDELAGLIADIKENRQREPVTFWKGQLLDGRNRAIACERLGIEPEAGELDPETDPVSWVLSHNLHRRHLTPSQKAQVAVRLKKLLEPDAKERKSAGGKAAGNGRPKKDAAKLPQAKSNGKRSPDSRSQAASMLGISGRLVDAAEKVEKKGTPELQAAVTSGKVSVSRAAKIADAPKSEQSKLIKEKPSPPERTVFTRLRSLFDEMTKAERVAAGDLWADWIST